MNTLSDSILNNHPFSSNFTSKIKSQIHRIQKTPAVKWDAFRSYFTCHVSWHKPFNNIAHHHLQYLALASIARPPLLVQPGLPDLSYSTATFLWWSAKRPFTQRLSSVSYCAVSGRLPPGSKQMADCHNYISESEAQRSESSLESVTERPLRAALDVYSCSHPLRHPWFKGLWRYLWLLKDCSRNWNL